MVQCLVQRLCRPCCPKTKSLYFQQSQRRPKKIERLPEPNEYEQKVLDRLQDEYIDGEVDLSLKSPSLYKGLKKGATLARRRSLFKKKRVFLSKSVEQKKVH